MERVFPNFDLMKERLLVEYTVEVRFGDIDVMGHVNNAVYLSYFEQARMAFFKELIGGEWDWNEAGILLARNEVDYIQPILLSDQVTVKTWCSKVGNSSLVIEYEVTRTPAGSTDTSVCTKGKSVLVCFDYHKKQKTLVPVSWKEKLVS